MLVSQTRARTSGAPDVAASPIVLIVDDDDDVRLSLESLFLSVGLEAAGYSSTSALLQAGLPGRPHCLVLDVRMPGQSGLDLQTHLNTLGIKSPIIFMTGYADVPMSVQAMRRGALNFLAKPFRDQDLLDAVREALEIDTRQRKDEGFRALVKEKARSLTPREREVLMGVDRGLMNKQIAFELGIAEITVKMHRSHASRKLGARSVPDLIDKIRALDLQSLDGQGS